MFAIAITNQPLKIADNEFDIKEFEQKGRVVTVCTGDLFTELEQIEEGFQITEYIANKQKVIPNTKILSRVIVDMKQTTIKIFNQTISGRTIYYLIQNEREFYCSTHIFLLRNFGIKLEENREVLPEFFIYRYVMPPNTLYKGIKKMFFGERLKFSFTNEKFSVIGSSHFVFPESKIREKSIDKISKKVVDILSNSIASLKPAKSDSALLLSGGLDSSILFKLSKDILDINRTFSTDYPFLGLKGDVEKRNALSASKALGAEHSYIEFTVEDYLRGFIEAIHVAEEPLHHLQSVLLYLLFKKGIPDEFHTIINGQGADGIFGLNLHNRIFACNSLHYRALSSIIGKNAIKLMIWLTGHGKGISDTIRLKDILKNSIDIGNPNHVIWELGAYGSEQWTMKYFDCSYNDIINTRFRAINEYRNYNIYDLISILDIIGDVRATSEIWNKLAEKNKKMIYYPFCEEELLNYSLSIFWDIKLQKPKNVLRHVAHALKVPEFIITRKKSGFGMGAEAWAVKGGAFEPLIPLCTGIFEKKEILQLQSTDPKKSMTFWNILNYCIWKRLFIYNDSVDDLVGELNIK